MKGGYGYVGNRVDDAAGRGETRGQGEVHETRERKEERRVGGEG